jgi:hypothetical protein
MSNEFKKIDERSWEKIRGKWLNHIPNFSNPGEVPSHTIGEILDLDAYYKEAKNQQGSFTGEVENLRSEILREAIFFAHKAIHVSGTAIVHLNNGILSWGISSSYQASFFSLKSIFGLLGLIFPRINHKTLMIDSFPKEEQLSKSKIKQGILPKQEIKFTIFPDLTHTQHWEIFQRLLRVTEIDFLDESYVNLMTQLEAEDFVSQRNNLHYVNNYWLITNDLFERVFDPSFGVRADLISNIYYAKTGQKDFTFLFSHLIIKLNVDLIRSLGELSESIKNEYDLIRKTLNEGIHDRLLNSVTL